VDETVFIAVLGGTLARLLLIRRVAPTHRSWPRRGRIAGGVSQLWISPDLLKPCFGGTCWFFSAISVATCFRFGCLAVLVSGGGYDIFLFDDLSECAEWKDKPTRK